MGVTRLGVMFSVRIMMGVKVRVRVSGVIGIRLVV